MAIHVRQEPASFVMTEVEHSAPKHWGYQHGRDPEQKRVEMKMLRKLFLACGVLSSLLYVAMNVFVPIQWDGYSTASQTVSELSAIGAPMRVLWLVPAAI